MTDKIDTTLTQDLFGVEDCSNCNGSGTIFIDLILNKKLRTREDNCEECGGTGVAQ